MALLIVIPARNEAARLGAGLALLAQSLKAQGLTDAQVVVADNGSTDATRAVAEAHANHFARPLQYLRVSESGDKGAWYEGPPGYTTIGEKLIAANDLNYKIISTGSEAALIELFSAAAENETPALGYFYEPQNFLAKVPLARVNFPANDWTDAEKASGLTDYPKTDLQKLATTKLMESGSPFATLVKNFNWTNEDQNMVALDIESGMTPEAAAQKWIDANKDKVDAWLAAG